MGYTNLDVKIITWERHTIEDDAIDEVMEILKNKDFNSSEKIDRIVNGDLSSDTEILYDCVETMEVYQNDDYPTIELLNSESEIIYANAIYKPRMPKNTPKWRINQWLKRKMPL